MAQAKSDNSTPAPATEPLYLPTDITPEQLFRAIGKLRKDARDEIDRLIRFLDETENHMAIDCESCDDDGEGEDAEPSLGSFDRMMDQSKSCRKCERDTDIYGYSDGVDLEQDDCDYEDCDPNEAKQQPLEMQ
jgi:hypothetical protein